MLSPGGRRAGGVSRTIVGQVCATVRVCASPASACLSNPSDLAVDSSGQGEPQAEFSTRQAAWDPKQHPPSGVQRLSQKPDVRLWLA